MDNLSDDQINEYSRKSYDIEIKVNNLINTIEQEEKIRQEELAIRIKMLEQEMEREKEIKNKRRENKNLLGEAIRLDKTQDTSIKHAITYSVLNNAHIPPEYIDIADDITNKITPSMICLNANTKEREIDAKIFNKGWQLYPNRTNIDAYKYYKTKYGISKQSIKFYRQMEQRNIIKFISRFIFFVTSLINLDYRSQLVTLFLLTYYLTYTVCTIKMTFNMILSIITTLIELIEPNCWMLVPIAIVLFAVYTIWATMFYACKKKSFYVIYTIIIIELIIPIICIVNTIIQLIIVIFCTTNHCDYLMMICNMINAITLVYYILFMIYCQDTPSYQEVTIMIKKYYSNPKGFIKYHKLFERYLI